MSPDASPANGGDELIRTLSDDGGVAVRTLVGTDLVERSRVLHGSMPTATHALGRALMGALLVASAAKEEETVQLNFRGDGPLGSMLAIAEVSGRVRGTVTHPETDLPARGGQADVSAAIGEGTIRVVRNHPRWRQPYTGITPLANGQVASDIARYLTESEQTPSAVGLGVALDSDGSVAAAGGFMVQALPGADEVMLAQVERNVRSIFSPAEMVRSGARGRDVAEILLQGVGHRELERTEPVYHCPCSMERVTRAMVTLGREELEQIVEQGETLEVRCEFCGERYAVTPTDLRGLVLSS
ncbi:MAG: Hsp33 family molecular chaperone HslO [Myxococcota bacterium]